MRLTFIGLSSFIIENEAGYRILIDPFNPSPQWTLGPDFPREFRDAPFGANIVLMSEPDADHAYAPGGWLQHAPSTSPDSNPFPGLNLRGTVVYEYNGDVNIAWHYTVDGYRLAHFGDNSHVLTADQLAEIGSPDIVFMAPPKADGSKLPAAVDIIRKNIALLKPKMVIFTHHLAPNGLPAVEDTSSLRTFFQEYFSKYASTNTGYKGAGSFMELCYCLENAVVLGKEMRFAISTEPTIEIDKTMLADANSLPKAILFTSMLAKESF